MLRLTHNQTITGPILINDIDDGLPNKTAKRGTGDPKKYHRDGNSLGGEDKSVEPDVNYPKQKCYIPKRKLTDTTVAGYIDLKETDRVLMSQYKGVIAGLQAGGFILVTNFTDADVAAPTITSAQIDNVSNDLNIGGTNFTSLSPNVSKVIITGTGAVTLTQAQIVAGGGSFSATAISIPASLVPSISDTSSFVQVLADDQTTTARALIEAPAITRVQIDVPTAGDLTLTGTEFTSISPTLSSVIITGAGAVTLTQTQITTGGGTVSNNSIVIPAALVPGIAATTSSAQVQADSLLSNVSVVVEAPIITGAQVGNPTAGDLTLTGTAFASLVPTLSSVIITGDGAVTLTETQITTGGGTVSDTSIVIPAALVPGIAATTSSAQVQADGLLSNVFVMTT